MSCKGLWRALPTPKQQPPHQGLTSKAWPKKAIFLSPFGWAAKPLLQQYLWRKKTPNKPQPKKENPKRVVATATGWTRTPWVTRQLAENKYFPPLKPPHRHKPLKPSQSTVPRHTTRFPWAPAAPPSHREGETDWGEPASARAPAPADRPRGRRPPPNARPPLPTPPTAPPRGRPQPLSRRNGHFLPVRASPQRGSQPFPAAAEGRRPPQAPFSPSAGPGSPHTHTHRPQPGPGPRSRGSPMAGEEEPPPPPPPQPLPAGPSERLLPSRRGWARPLSPRPTAPPAAGGPAPAAERSRPAAAAPLPVVISPVVSMEGSKLPA